MKVVAIDIGFGFTKVTDGSRHQVFKSLVGEANTSPFTDSMVPLDSDCPRGISFEDGDYFVGEMAETHSVNQIFSLDPAQHLAQQARPLAFCGLIPMCDSGEPIRVVTGLPVSLYRKYEGELTKALQGRHEVEIIVNEDVRRRHILNIERVRVIPQPFGSLYSQLLDRTGEPVKGDMARRKYGVIDVGFKTSDYVIAHNTRYVERGSRSSENGISAAYKVVADTIADEFDIDVELFRLNEWIKSGTIKLRDKHYDLGPIKEQTFKLLAERIATDVEVLWQRDWDCESVLVTGGGGADLYPYLKDLITNDTALIEGAEDQRLCNVMGYWRYGRHIWQHDHPEATTVPTEVERHAGVSVDPSAEEQAGPVSSTVDTDPEAEQETPAAVSV